MLCDTVQTTLKKYNANQHYIPHKDHICLKLEGGGRKPAVPKMKQGKQYQEKAFSSLVVPKQGTVTNRGSTQNSARTWQKRVRTFSDVEIIRNILLKRVMFGSQES